MVQIDVLPGWTIDDIAYQVVSSQEVADMLSGIADLFGYGWCGGTNGKWDVKKEGSKFRVVAHYDEGAEGYWADKRLNMIFENFRLKFNPGDIKFGDAQVTEFEPDVAAFTTLRQNGPDPASMQVSVNYDLVTAVTHTTDTKISVGMEWGTEGEVGVPLVSNGKVSFKFSLGVEHGWSDSTQTSVSTGLSVSTTTSVPGNSSVSAKIMGKRTVSDVPYTATATVAFDVTFDNFLRWSWNAHVPQVDDRPWISQKFGGDKGQSAVEQLLNWWDHRHIAGWTGDWDLNRAEQKYEGEAESRFNWLRSSPIVVKLSGRFTGVKGEEVDVEFGAPVPTSEPAEKVAVNSDVSDVIRVKNVDKKLV